MTKAGDRFELETPYRKISDAMDEIVIVGQDDDRVLRPRTRPALTLVTCYPFTFVVNAPKHYIVHVPLQSVIPGWQQ